MWTASRVERSTYDTPTIAPGTALMRASSATRIESDGAPACAAVRRPSAARRTVIVTNLSRRQRYAATVVTPRELPGPCGYLDDDVDARRGGERLVPAEEIPV